VTGLEAAVAAAAKAVAQRAAREWLAARAAKDERDKELSELIQVSFSDRFARRKLERQLADIADSVERRLSGLVTVEYRGLRDNDRAAVFAEISKALERADLSDAALLHDDADPVKLARRVRAKMPPPVGQLGEAGERLYEVGLDECCDCLIRIIRQLPQFAPRAAAEMLSRLSGLGEQIGTVLDRLPVRSLDAPAGTRTDAEFERRYLEYLSSVLDEVELFGVRVENYRPRAALSIAYISLNVTAERAVDSSAGSGPLRFAALTRELEDERQVPTMRAETALARFSRTLLRGQAGSGKSTLLRWVAVTAARGGFTGDLTEWNGRVPFLIKLRSFAEGPLPQPEDFVIGPLRGLMPTGWAHRVLSQGRAVMLADGVDELPEARRVAVRQWLRSLLAAYPLIRMVVSSRPAAAESRWLADEGFSTVVLEPMGPSELRQLVRQWHVAIRQAPSLPCSADELPGYEGALLARLEGGAHLRALATTPLLAAMMCALNLDRATHLPRDRMGLYAAALDMLLERRDAERGIPDHLGITLDREQQIRILQDLAWQLTVFGRTEMSAATALKRVSDKIASMPRVTAPPASILEHLLQRSGVIREPVPGRIDFVHRTVQEYLAAAQAADDANIEPLIARAHLDQWRETVIMAAGHANAPLRQQLLAGLLDRAEAEARHGHRLRLLTAACLETVPDVPTSLRDRVSACLAGLIPPRSADEVRPLASVGEQVISRMPASLTSLTTAEAVATVRAVWLINGNRAMDCLSRYASDPRTKVQDELVSAWGYFDPREYARRVLADASLHHGQLTLDDPALFPGIPHLHNLRDLRIRLPGHADLDRLGGLPFLTSVRAERATVSALSALAEHVTLRKVEINSLDGPASDLSALLALPALRELTVYNGQFVSDLSFLTRLPRLKFLALPGLEEVDDFTPLASQPALTRLALFGCKQLNDIEVLRPLNALWQLSLSEPSLQTDSVETIVRTWPRLRWLELVEMDSFTSLEPITALPLEELAISLCPQLTDITPLGRLHNLKWLYMVGTPFEDLQQIAELKKLRSLSLGKREKPIDLTPLAGLPNLHQLWLYDISEDTDLTPLEKMRNLTIFMWEGQHIQGLERLHRSTRVEWRPRPSTWLSSLPSHICSGAHRSPAYIGHTLYGSRTSLSYADGDSPTGPPDRPPMGELFVKGA
jgi:NACHT N-terminal Helical domain 1/NACHT domain